MGSQADSYFYSKVFAPFNCTLAYFVHVVSYLFRIVILQLLLDFLFLIILVFLVGFFILQLILKVHINE